MHFWDIISKEVIYAFRYVFSTSTKPNVWKRTYIALIPKTSSLSRSLDYWPISLCNTIYKILAKVLANRLKSILPNIISLEQGAFIQVQHITNQILLS